MDTIFQMIKLGISKITPEQMLIIRDLLNTLLSDDPIIKEIRFLYENSSRLAAVKFYHYHPNHKLTGKPTLLESSQYIAQICTDLKPAV